MTTTKKHFLNPKESAVLTGKSEITMKRFIKSEYNQATTKDDQCVLSLITRKKAPKGFFWFIEEDYLREKFNILPQEKKEDKIMDIFVDQLRTKDDQIKAKDQQLEKKDEQIKSLLERQRENNILMKGLQDKVLVLESGTPEEVFSEEKTGEYSDKTEDQETQSETAKTPQKGFWGRIFS